MVFELHPRLAKDTIVLGDCLLCRVLLMDDVRFPWLILVPRRTGVSELFELTSAERAALVEEVAAACDALKAETGCDKLNIGALGNLVTQLHVHIVGRFAGDAAWPGPVWGFGRPQPYAGAAADALMPALSRRLALARPFDPSSRAESPRDHW
jgi:diadenosine tetraphosphate (Ap4A) HIT family hydrolase